MLTNRGGNRRLSLVRTLAGYTIVEVMIFLGVSSAIFIAAALLLSGQQGKTEFSQGMRDLNAKLQNTISEVRTGFYPNSQSSQCTVDLISGEIIVTSSGTNKQGSNQQCLYLGKAVHFEEDSDTFSIYTVLGKRTYRNALGVNIIAEKFTQTDPQPIFYPTGSPNLNLTEEYSVPFGAVFKSSKIARADNGTEINDINMVGFYSSLEDTTSDSRPATGGKAIDGTQSVFALVYDPNGVAPPRGDGQVKQCVREDSTPTDPCNKATVGKWVICFDSQSSDQHGIITVSTSVAGVNTELEIFSGNC